MFWQSMPASLSDTECPCRSGAIALSMAFRLSAMSFRIGIARISKKATIKPLSASSAMTLRSMISAILSSIGLGFGFVMVVSRFSTPGD